MIKQCTHQSFLSLRHDSLRLFVFKTYDNLAFLFVQTHCSMILSRSTFL